MDKEFEPQLYHNEYQVRLREIIEAKINGQEIVQTPAEQESNVINIMEALQASLQQIEGTTPPKKPRGRKKAATA
jgi:DNA end-binding protein Ku